MPQRAQASLGGELREGGRLVVAALREALERLLAEDVDAAADPLVEPRRLAKAGDQVVVEVDHAERRAQRDDRDRRGRGALAVEAQQGREVDVDQLVAVQREQVALLAPRRRREADAPAPPERLRLGDRDDLGAEAAERRLEGRLLAGRSS